MIRNLTKKRVLAEKKIICRSILSKAIGLMFSRRIRNTGLVFVFDREQRISIHMLFVFFPIDILFLNEKKEVVKIKYNLRPFTFYKSNKKMMYFIELIDCMNAEIGDKILF